MDIEINRQFSKNM